MKSVIPDYSNQKLVRNESLYPIGHKELQTRLHQSIGALTSLNSMKQMCLGSGVLISPDLVLTAAHNIYDKSYNQEHTSFRFYLGADGVAQHFHEVQSSRYLTQFKECLKSVRLEFDYALIKLKSPIVLEGYLPLAEVCEHCLMETNSETVLEIFGFPDFDENYKPLDKFGKKFVLKQYGLARQNRIIYISPQIFTIAYALSTLAGQSGTCVFTENKIIGIHCGGGKKQEEFNMGRLITPDLLLNLQRWRIELKAHHFQRVEGKFCPFSNKRNTVIEQQQRQIEQQRRQIEQLRQCLAVEKRNSLSSNKGEVQQLIQVLDEKDERIQKLQQHLRKKEVMNGNLMLQIEALQRVQSHSKIYEERNSLLPKSVISEIQKAKKGESLNLSEKLLAEIDISHLANLKQLWLSNNKLTYIDLRSNYHLTKLDVSRNQIRSIDLTNSTKLADISLYQNQLTSIDLSKNTQLSVISLYENQLMSIDLSYCSNIQTLWLRQNNLRLVVLWWYSQLRDYNLSIEDQRLPACEVILLHHKGEMKECVQWGKKWIQQYNKNKGSNKHGCKYGLRVEEQK